VNNDAVICAVENSLLARGDLLIFSNGMILGSFAATKSVASNPLIMDIGARPEPTDDGAGVVSARIAPANDPPMAT
jgi:hypothetical protein